MGWIADLISKSQEIPISGVLKERLDYTQQKYDDLEAEKNALAEQVEQLSVENADLRAAIRPSADAQPDYEITDEISQILQQVNRLEDPLAEDIARSMQLAPARAEYHLKNLLEHGYLRDMWYDPGQHFRLSQRGREYLIEEGYI